MGAYYALFFKGRSASGTSASFCIQVSGHLTYGPGLMPSLYVLLALLDGDGIINGLDMDCVSGDVSLRLRGCITSHQHLFWQKEVCLNGWDRAFQSSNSWLFQTGWNWSPLLQMSIPHSMVILSLFTSQFFSLCLPEAQRNTSLQPPGKQLACGDLPIGRILLLYKYR